ncbi:bifunctional phosphoribosylaminoimidazolecarboxamide formyltransferase/IMP cyclohydrolase [Buchnera aphidicola]|uniref:bifunctional phosphoribosylaminoimidazolecarboxamide formyltransferase/IMP cyclohydrolase n=1 Tax=Buchnera aphidicola TaxID=9 RepID=UPI0031B8929C
MKKKKKIKTALLSVANKKNIIEFSKKLIYRKIKLFATNGTAKILKKNNIPVKKISDYIKFPEILNGKIKTLHPKIYGGILAKKKNINEINKYKIKKFDLIVVNFYKFKIKNNNKKNNLKKISEFIDIGGPSIARAAVKNYKNVIIIHDIKDYKKIINKIDQNKINSKMKFKFAIKTFKYITLYDIKILNFILKKKKKKILPKKLTIKLLKNKKLRYGENQHQKSALYYKKKIIKNKNIIFKKKIQGKKLSYNNIYDANIALECVKTLKKPACVIVKHGNPCGCAIGKNIFLSYKSAYKTDIDSCFGGIIAFNDFLDETTIKYILKKQFVEIIIAPKISLLAKKIIKKKKNIRVLIYNKKIKFKKNELDIKSINNGFLIQTKDKKINIKKYINVTKKKPNKKEIKDLLFAWKIVKFAKSNAIVYAKNLMTKSIGSGQTSRIDAIKMANKKAKETNKKINFSVLASDAFLPFKDNINLLSKNNITCIIQPGGSIRDKEIIKEANKKNIAMIFTNIRQFKH